MLSADTSRYSAGSKNAFSTLSHIIAPALYSFIGDFESIQSMIVADDSIVPEIGEINQFNVDNELVIVFSGPREDVSIICNFHMCSILSITRHVKVATNDFSYVCSPVTFSLILISSSYIRFPRA